VFLRYSHEICDSRSCSELEAVIVGAYLHLRVLIISPKFRLKTPCGLGDPLIASWRLFLSFSAVLIRTWWTVREVIVDRPLSSRGPSARCLTARLLFVFVGVLERLSLDPFCRWIFGA
jgi:hypothetical protein